MVVNMVSLAGVTFPPVIAFAMILIFTLSFTSLSVSSLPLAIARANYYEKVYCVGIFFSVCQLAKDTERQRILDVIGNPGAKRRLFKSMAMPPQRVRTFGLLIYKVVGRLVIGNQRLPMHKQAEPADVVINLRPFADLDVFGEHLEV